MNCLVGGGCGAFLFSSRALVSGLLRAVYGRRGREPGVPPFLEVAIVMGLASWRGRILTAPLAAAGGKGVG